MSSDLINIGLGFLEGFALIISPCILPILPIILAGSLEGSKRRPLGIVTGFVLTFALFTFFSRKLVQYSGIDLALIRHISFAVLFLLGVIMISTYLSEKFARLTQRLANVGVSSGTQPKEGFYSGMVFGGLIGLVWTPCAGPILAAVIVQTVIQTTSLSSFFIVLAFGLGAAIPMLIIALFGRGIMAKMTFFRNRAELLRKLVGVVIIASVFYMIYADSLTLSFAKTSVNQTQNTALINGVLEPYPAPEIAGITAWINSSPLQISQLKGKVVLIDFWTYSCINCLRTLPYIKDWYAKYHDKGFEIIGVHSPEFDFEKNLENVKSAVAQDGIKYPIALDNNFATWRNFNNSYWPAHYLIDKNGNVVYEHFGEGEYATTENNIRFLLGLNQTANPANFGEEANYGAQTPETYLGYARMENYASPEAITHNHPAKYTFPASLDENQWALQGSWNVTSQNIVSAENNASLRMHFNARKVFIVMGNTTGFPIEVKLMLNGQPVTHEKGKDVVNSRLIVKNNRLYEAIVLPHPSSDILQLTASAPGLEVYTFTFGG
ncbi:MAG: cytochrome c biogenesis protein DipZ [Gammaproteobacteria bacterium]